MRASPKRPPAEPGHISVLDGVRGLAVMLVMLHHFAYGSVGVSLPARLFVSFADGGWMGVDLFFVLSGYLITGILLDSKDGAHYFRNFYARRTLRIFPLYYGYLFVFCVIIGHFVHIDPERTTELLSYQQWLWLYGTNVLICIRGAFLVASVNHFWSLAIEEHFYLVWPTLVKWVDTRKVWMACVACVVVALLTRIAFHITGVWRPAPMVFTLCRIDALALGGLLSTVLRKPENEPQLRRWSVFALAAAAPVVALFLLGGRSLPWADAILRTVGYTIIAAFFAAFLTLALLTRGWFHRWLSHPAMCFFGVYAYGLYVFHHPLRIFLQRALPFEKLGVMVHSYWLGLTLHASVALIASVIVALASYHFYEKQFLRLKRYFARR